jgi:F0F1-type ATP synthase membrane subunit c/vacuolar-type H+-ATPase subunit K
MINKENNTDGDILKKLFYLFIFLVVTVVLTLGIAFILSFQ